MSKRITQNDIEIANRLKEAKKILKFKYIDIAKLLGVSSHQAAKYVQGKNRISAGSLKEIADYLQLSITYFYIKY